MRLAPETKLRFRPGVKKRGQSAERFKLYSGARAMGEFFDLHLGPEARAKTGLANDLKKKLCETP